MIKITLPEIYIIEQKRLRETADPLISKEVRDRIKSNKFSNEKK